MNHFTAEAGLCLLPFWIAVHERTQILQRNKKITIPNLMYRNVPGITFIWYSHNQMFWMHKLSSLCFWSNQGFV